jgi:curved DNA-binding protein CbpA
VKRAPIKAVGSAVETGIFLQNPPARPARLSLTKKSKWCKSRLGDKGNKAMGKRIIQSPVPFVLRKIYLEKCSGELRLKSDTFEKTLYFLKGDLCFARTNVLNERLGEILFKIGKIDQAQFLELHKLLSSQKNKIGSLMVENHILSQKDLHFGLIYQLRAIALSTFSLSSGEWEFLSLIPEIPDDSKFKIELPAIFSEGVREFKNLVLFKNNFSPRALAVKPMANELKDFLKPAEIAFYEELRRRSPAAAGKIGSEVGLPDDEYWQNLMFFFLLDLLEFGDGLVEKGADGKFNELHVFYEKLRSKEIDYYELFNLKNTAPFSEIKEVYYQYAKKFHPDRFGESPDPELKEKANYVFAYINKAFDVLNSEEKRKEYDIRGYKEIQAMEKPGESMVEKANLFYRKAKSLYAQKKFLEASSFLEEAVRNDNSKASYFLLLGMSQSNVPALRRVAEKNLQKVIEMEPWNVEPLVALGLLFLGEKFDKRAESFFRRALAIDPDNEVALSKMAELTSGGKKQSVLSVFKKKK